eukprot:5682170-Amphidinium_carterae.1
MTCDELPSYASIMTCPSLCLEALGGLGLSIVNAACHLQQVFGICAALLRLDTRGMARLVFMTAAML